MSRGSQSYSKLCGFKFKKNVVQELVCLAKTLKYYTEVIEFSTRDQHLPPRTLQEIPPHATAYLWGDDLLYGGLYIALKDMCLGELLLPVGSQPDFGQWPPLVDEQMDVEHGAWPKVSGQP